MIAIAIDGPAGAGKSTIAKTLAKELGFVYVDTGALYRTIGLHAMEEGTDPKDGAGVIATLASADISLAYEGGTQHVYLNGRDVSEAIRTPEASMAASAVSAVPEVRAFLFDLQRDMAKKQNIIMDGRDIGTVVLPNADLKIFLTATPEERAKRRYKELTEKGMQVEYDSILKEIIQRDHNDSTRAVAPLKQAEDAVLVDTSALDLEESVAALNAIVKERLPHVL